MAEGGGGGGPDPFRQFPEAFFWYHPFFKKASPYLSFVFCLSAPPCFLFIPLNNILFCFVFPFNFLFFVLFFDRSEMPPRKAPHLSHLTNPQRGRLLLAICESMASGGTGQFSRTSFCGDKLQLPAEWDAEKIRTTSPAVIEAYRNHLKFYILQDRPAPTLKSWPTFAAEQQITGWVYGPDRQKLLLAANATARRSLILYEFHRDFHSDICYVALTRLVGGPWDILDCFLGRTPETLMAKQQWATAHGIPSFDLVFLLTCWHYFLLSSFILLLPPHSFILFSYISSFHTKQKGKGS